MATNNFVKVLWEFGDGRTSNELNPIIQFEPGVYTIKLTVWNSDGSATKITKVEYIGVSSLEGTLADSNYIDDPKIYHYGWKDEHGYGWSMNTGEFPIPITHQSVGEYEEDGVVHCLVWDARDGYEYVINTRNDHISRVTYKDKETYSIPATIITSEFTGEMKRYDIEHIETNMTFRPDIMQTAFTEGQSVSVSLLTDAEVIPVETQYSVDTTREIDFYYQSKQSPGTSSRQLEIVTTESNFQLLDYESMFKTMDRYKKAGSGVSSSSQESMAFFAMPLFWVTRGKGYNLNRVTGESSGTFLYSPTTGPDGVSNSAMSAWLNEPPFDSPAGGSIVFWGKNATSVSLPGLIEYTVVDGWSLYYYNGAVPSDLKLLGVLFDIRIFSSVISEANLKEYADKYLLYLPRA